MAIGKIIDLVAKLEIIRREANKVHVVAEVFFLVTTFMATVAA
jgi:hypothetical protein